MYFKVNSELKTLSNFSPPQRIPHTSMGGVLNPHSRYRILILVISPAFAISVLAVELFYSQGMGLPTHSPSIL
jgi:hypothetical protein